MVSVDYELHVSMFLVFTVAAVCATMLLVLMFANKNVVLSVVSVVLLTAILAAVGNEVIYVKAMFDGLTQEVVSCRGLPLDEIFIFPVEAPVAPADEAPATVAPAPEAPAVVAPVIPTVTPAAPQQPAATATAPADANGAGKMELQSDGTFKFVPAGK